MRNEKYLFMENYVTNFQQLPLNLVYSFDAPDDQVAMLNKLIKTVLTFMHRSCIAPWMHDPKIIELQKELASQRENYRNHKNSINHKNYQNTRNKL